MSYARMSYNEVCARLARDDLTVPVFHQPPGSAAVTAYIPSWLRDYVPTIRDRLVTVWAPEQLTVVLVTDVPRERLRGAWQGLVPPEGVL